MVLIVSSRVLGVGENILSRLYFKALDSGNGINQVCRGIKTRRSILPKSHPAHCLLLDIAECQSRIRHVLDPVRIDKVLETRFFTVYCPSSRNLFVIHKEIRRLCLVREQLYIFFYQILAIAIYKYLRSVLNHMPRNKYNTFHKMDIESAIKYIQNTWTSNISSMISITSLANTPIHTKRPRR